MNVLVPSLGEAPARKSLAAVRVRAGYPSLDEPEPTTGVGGVSHPTSSGPEVSVSGAPRLPLQGSLNSRQKQPEQPPEHTIRHPLAVFYEVNAGVQRSQRRILRALQEAATEAAAVERGIMRELASTSSGSQGVGTGPLGSAAVGSGVQVQSRESQEEEDFQERLASLRSGIDQSTVLDNKDVDLSLIPDETLRELMDFMHSNPAANASSVRTLSQFLVRYIAVLGWVWFGTQSRVHTDSRGPGGRCSIKSCFERISRQTPPLASSPIVLSRKMAGVRPPYDSG